MFRLCSLLLVLLPLLNAVSPVAGRESESPPNIVLLLSDDMGWADPGFNGGNHELTPSIDRLAAESRRLTQFYAHSVCAPTRSALMTGRYAFRDWMDWRSEDFGKPSYLNRLGLKLAHLSDSTPTRMIHGLDTTECTLAEALRDAGYFTAIAGKWHLGEWLPEHLPMGQGFEHQYGHYAWGIDYNNYTIPHNAPARFAVYDWHRNQQPLNEQGYSTDLFANEAVRLIAEHDSNRPFFVYVPFNAIHGPLEQIPRYTDKLGKRSAALKCLDDAVGRIVGAVDQHGHSEDTIIIFANDNGGLTEEVNRPFRGTKNTTFEGGVRVPCLVRWPGHIEPGSVSNDMMHMVDLLPTLVKIAGGSTQSCKPLDGIDMSGVILHGETGQRSEVVFDVADCVRLPTIRSGDFKLMGDMLFNIRNDPSETTDIAAANPTIVERLSSRLAALERERPALQNVPGTVNQLMNPALPWVYGQAENLQSPDWLKQRMTAVRKQQPQHWPKGKTPWPQAPTGATIQYTGDGR